ncbi:MAG: PilZ domain-containing protein [Inquilinus sp.]|nr:PilZ domain-containing protein [Inquilinus sp.]
MIATTKPAETVDADADAPRGPLDRQQHLRRSILVSARLLADDRSVPCQIVNLSAGGIRVRLDEPFGSEGPTTLKVDGQDSIRVELAWCRDDLAGFRYAAGPKVIQAFIESLEQAQPSVMEQRRHVRCSVLWSASVFSGGQTAEAVVLNLSASGAKIRLVQPTELEDRVMVSMPRFGDFPGRLVWRNECEIGVEFLDPPERIAELLGGTLPRIRQDITGQIE